MVKTRFSRDGQKAQRVFKRLHDRFGRYLTHRLITTTEDAEGRVTAMTTADVTFFGELQTGSAVDEKLINSGWVELGDAVLYVSSTESENANLVAKKSIIIEGTSAGTYHAWEIIEIIDEERLGADLLSSVFRLKKRTDETIT